VASALSPYRLERREEDEATLERQWTKEEGTLNL
jgi:hypothetical protein